MAMTLRLSDHDEQLLAALAEAEGVSKHEATVRAIRAAGERRLHRAQVRQASAVHRERYADLLDRLGR
ncbi:MAG TPA: CopG family transcriptional regulator [Candidatus Dietzia intestinipullorum]|nr:CopG family transcriptional regulator [Candidatus Dietzia intestinipullorum]